MFSRLIAITTLLLVFAPFHVATAAPLEGSWSGAGFVSPKSGQRERVRCRVSYQKQTAKVYSISANCASKSASLTQSGTLTKVRNDRFVGDIYNPEFDIRGRVRVIIKGSRQTVTFTSAAANGKLNLRKR
ncbi:MAG: hypothetical protein AAGG72_06760 [Pseudomonadota bacterium]